MKTSGKKAEKVKSSAGNGKGRLVREKTGSSRKKAEPKIGKPAQKTVMDPLRKRAEALIGKRLGKRKSEALSYEETQRLIHELQTFQIELEIQNEELRNAQISLLNAKERYADLYDFAPVGYFTFDAQGRILDVNLTGASLLGVERKSLLGRSFIHYLKRDSIAVFGTHMSEVLKKGERQECELELMRRDGTTFFAALGSMPSAGDAVRTVVNDISARKSAEAEILRLAEDKTASSMEIALKNKDLETFMYSFSHDLRAPLRHISEFARILGEDYRERLDERGRDYLQRMQRGAAKMTVLIDSLLNLSRVVRQGVDRMKIDVSKLSHSIVSELRNAEPERDVEVVITEGLSAFADLRLTEVVLSNLFENAWKFTSKTKDARMEFGAVQKDGKNIYYVKDNGAGFDQGYASKMFQPFQRLHSEKEFPGTGIGLTIVERIIESHGGRIWAEGEAGKGATVYFTLE
jgi:PAS domain S-box-containing protein